MKKPLKKETKVIGYVLVWILVNTLAYIVEPFLAFITNIIGLGGGFLLSIHLSAPTRK